MAQEVRKHVYNLRLTDEEQHQLEMIAEETGLSGASVIRSLIKERADAIVAQRRAREAKSFWISAWNGSDTRCIFWVGASLADALTEAKRLAVHHEGDQWTVFRVYEQGREEPVHVEPVKVTTPKQHRRK
jgi:predicted DNA-binding protein